MPEMSEVPISGHDSWRIWFQAPDGSLDEFPAINRRAMPRIVARLQPLGWKPIRAERIIGGSHGKRVPWGLDGNPVPGQMSLTLAAAGKDGDGQ